MTSEFDLIKNYFSETEIDREDVALGLGDDCALINVPEKHQLVLTTDTLVAGQHFRKDADPHSLGYKSLAVSLSDLASMAALPRWLMLSLTLPEADEDWLGAFMQGFNRLAGKYQLQLIGGDTTAGPLSVTVQAMGTVLKGRAVKREGAQSGDIICVTGSLGDAGLALREPEIESVQQFLHQPIPRVEQGQKMTGLATAAIDISDGLSSDLEHLCTASFCGARIQLSDLPISEIVARQHDWSLVLSSGDDYELCMTVNKENLTHLKESIEATGCRLTAIGEITKSKEILWLDEQGVNYQPPTGFDHFK